MPLLAAATLLAIAACGDDGPEGMQHCEGAKCDDPNGTPTPHASAVLACEATYDKAIEAGVEGSADALAIEESYRQCLRSVNDAAIVTIEDNLLQPEVPSRSREEIAIVFDEYRYASLCTDVESASSALGDDLSLLVEQCEVRREHSLAIAVGALVDFSGERTIWELADQRERFTACYDAYDEVLAENPTPAQSYAARGALVGCAADDLRAHSELIKDAHCEKTACNDELVILSFIRAGFDTAIVTTDRACQMLVDASIYREDQDPQQILDCEIAVYAELKTAVLAGIGQ